MNGLNKVMIIGNLGRDPEVTVLNNLDKVAKFPMATTDYYKDKDGTRKETTEWHNIVMWKGLADLAEKYLKKGMSVYIEGKMKTRKWESKGGESHYSTEVIADSFIILTKKDTTE